MGIGDFIAMVIVAIGIIALIAYIIIIPKHIKHTKKLIQMLDEYELRYGNKLKHRNKY